MHRAASARLVHLSMGVMPAHCKWTAVAASTSPPLGPSSTAHAGVRHGARSHLPLHCLPALRRRQDAAERTASRQTAAFASNNGVFQSVAASLMQCYTGEQCKHLLIARSHTSRTCSSCVPAQLMRSMVC